MTDCPICSARLASGLTDWHRVCAACGFEASTLEPCIDDRSRGGALDEALRETALRKLRVDNFERVLDRIVSLRPPDDGILEVGCAHGWFLEQCGERGIDAVGLEPDAEIADATLRRGLRVRKGAFPAALDPAERYGAIVFNDVFEHLTDPRDVLAACRRQLAPGGLLVINLPCATGFFYRLSKGMARAGLEASFERMWQKGFPSPHLSYFSQPGLAALCREGGFVEVSRERLPSVSIEGLWERLRFGGGTSWALDVLKWSAIVGARPLLRFLPPDISLQVFREQT